MNSLNRVVVVLITAFLSAPSSLAQERTARIIEDLVSEIAGELARLEQGQQSHTSEFQRLETARAGVMREFDATEDAALKEEIRARLVELDADSNALEAESVEFGMRTLERIVPALKRLKRHLLELDGQDDVHQGELRSNRALFLHKAARLVDQISRDDNGEILRDVEKKLVSEYRLGSEGSLADRSMLELDEAISYLESVYVDLGQAHRDLEFERWRLAAVSGTSVGNFVAIKIANALDSTEIGWLAQATRDRIDDRRRAGELLEQERVELPLGRGEAWTPAQADDLSRLREGWERP